MLYNFYINAIIDRLENNFAIIRTFDQQEILWPLDNLPKNLTQGSAVKLIIKSDKDLEKDQQIMARSLLEEVFNEHSQ